MAGEDWRRLADYVVARRVELGMRDRRAFAQATGVTERTLGKLENGQRVSPSTLGMVENRLGWAPGSCRRILAGGEPDVGMPSMKTRRCGTSRARRGCPPTWFAASSHSPGTGGRAATAQTTRPGGAPDRRLPGRLPCPAGSRGHIRHGQGTSLRTRARWASTRGCSRRIESSARGPVHAEQPPPGSRVHQAAGGRG
jgi:hypothetical protein